MTTTQNWTEQTVEVGGVKQQVFKGGSGTPLIVLHGARGNPGWMPYHQALSEHFTVYAPSHPGYDKSERPSWVATITDVAHFYLGVHGEHGPGAGIPDGLLYGGLDSRGDNSYVSSPGERLGAGECRRY